MTQPQGFFITATGTDIGKTSVAKLLAEALSSRCLVTYMKPIQTGCMYNVKHELYAPDFDVVTKSGITLAPETKLHVPYCFEPACSPHLAAHLAGITIDLQHIATCFQTIISTLGKKTLCLVEGAGGVYVPLNEHETMFDLMHMLGLPILVVTSPGLGTLNHTLLTLEALKNRSLPVAGVIMNNANNVPEDFLYEDNRATIRKAALPALFLELPYGSNAPMNSVKDFCDELIKQQI